MYGSIFELPSQVRNSFNEDDQKVFMDTYNGFDPKTAKDIKEALRKTWHKCKNLDSAFTFEIIAGADDVDKDREIITVDSIKKNLDDFINAGGNVQYEHGDYNIGTIYDWAPMKLKDDIDAVKVWGAVYGNNDVSREARKKFKKGLNSLSVAGEADFGKYSCEDGKCATRRNVHTLMEISLCTVPANKHCKLISSHEGSNKGFAKSDSFINLPVQVVSFHEPSSECPLRSLERSLRDIGYTDAKATQAGVRISMSNMDFAKAVPYMEQNNLHVSRVGNDVYLVDREYLIEKSYKYGLENGYIEPDGTLNDNITKSEFRALVEKGVLDNDGGIFRIKRC